MTHQHKKYHTLK